VTAPSTASLLAAVELLALGAEQHKPEADVKTDLDPSTDSLGRSHRLGTPPAAEGA
jgi:hypothetical protein